MPRLFERFHRVPSARARSNEGSGIGLALVRELVGLHGGAIDAEQSRAAGTTFTITLPFGSAHLGACRRGRPGAHRGSTGAPTTTPGSPTPPPYVQEALRWLPTRRSARAPSLVTPATGSAAGRVLSPTTTPTCATT